MMRSGRRLNDQTIVVSLNTRIARAAVCGLMFAIAIVFATALAHRSALAADRTASEVLAEREQVQNEMNQLEGQFNANNDRMASLEAEFNNLEGRKSVAAANMLQIEGRIEQVEIKQNEINVESPQLDAELAAINQESASYDASCSGSLPEAQYNTCVSLASDFNSRNEDLKARTDSWNQRLSAVQQDVLVIEQDYLAAEAEINYADEQQAELARQGVEIDAENEALAQRGVELEHRLTALDLELATLKDPDTPCDPDDFATFEAFEECMRGVFGEGGGPKAGAPTDSKQTWNPFSKDGKKKSKKSGPIKNPFAEDTSVVQPDWDGQGGD